MFSHGDTQLYGRLFFVLLLFGKEVLAARLHNPLLWAPRDATITGKAHELPLCAVLFFFRRGGALFWRAIQ